MPDGTKKKRVQGEAPRVTSCEAGGEHVLWRPVQKYCDRCRPKDKAADLERHRARRARLKAEVATAPSGESAAVATATIAEQQPPFTLADVLDAALKLIEQRRSEVEKQVDVEIARRRRNGFPTGPAHARLDPYRDMSKDLAAVKQLAIQLGL